VSDVDAESWRETEYGRRARTPSLSLLERERELATIGQLLEDVEAGEGAWLLIDGPAGIGKSALLRAGASLARDRGWQILSATAHELAPRVALVVARGLLGSDFADGAPGEEDAAAAPQAISARLVRIVLDAATAHPLLLEIDDMQWCDPASLRWLAMLAANLWQAPVLLVTAARTGGKPDSPELAELLGRRADAIVRPAPLSPTASAQLLARRLGREPENELGDACHRTTGGNPYLLQTLADALRQSGPARAHDALQWVRDVGARALARSVAARLDALNADSRALVEAAAVVGDLGDVAEVGALVGLDSERASDAAALLAAADFFDTPSVAALAHPLVATTIQRSLPASRRAALKRGAARRLAARGELEEAAARLVELPPEGSDDAVTILARAATLARGHGAPDLAAVLLRRALAEQPGGNRERELQEQLGETLLSVGDPQAVPVLADALERARDAPGPEHAVLATRLALALMLALRVQEAVSVLDEHAQRLRAKHPAAAEELEAQMLYFSSFDARLRRARAARLGELGEQRGMSELAYRARLLGLADLSLGACEPAAKTIALVQRSLAGGLLLSRMPAACNAAATNLIQLGETSLAREHLQDAMSAARRRGDTVLLTTGLSLHGEARRVEGALVAAEIDMRTALELAGGRDVGVPFMICGLLEVLVERGAVAEAGQQLRHAGLEGELPDLVSRALILYARGGMYHAAGAAWRGLEDVLLAGEALRRFEVDSPAAVPWRSRAASIMLELGEPGSARELAAEEVELAQRIGASKVLGPALRVRGLVLGGERGCEDLKRAVAVLEPSSARLEYARALTDLGEALRARDQFTAARQHLHAAVELATELGGTVLAARAGEALQRAGGRARGSRGDGGPAALTPSERRVASLAAQGLTNREIADTLVLSTKTVETHLSSAFRKLGIKARSELDRALAPG
jgi:DNA-binding CsgD family transcriptional regulator